MLSLPWTNFVHQTCIAGLVKHLSPYTGCISEWISFALSPFAHKKRMTARCSLRNDFNGNVAIFDVSKWRHRDVIQLVLMFKFPTKYIFRIVYIWKINRMTLFCNLFIERPSYLFSTHAVIYLAYGFLSVTAVLHLSSELVISTSHRNITIMFLRRTLFQSHTLYT